MQRNTQEDKEHEDMGTERYDKEGEPDTCRLLSLLWDNRQHKKYSKIPS